MLIFRMVIASCLVLGSSMARPQNRPEKEQFVIVPPENVMLLVASQPDSPLLIEQPKLLVSVEPRQRPRFEYQVRNIGKKVIRSYSIAAWSSDQTGGTLGGQPAKVNMRPGDTREPIKSECEIVPLTETLRDRLGLKGKMRGLFVLMVYEVTFEDGSKYDGEPTSRALLQLFESNFH